MTIFPQRWQRCERGGDYDTVLGNGVNFFEEKTAVSIVYVCEEFVRIIRRALINGQWVSSMPCCVSGQHDKSDTLVFPLQNDCIYIHACQA